MQGVACLEQSILPLKTPDPMLRANSEILRKVFLRPIATHDTLTNGW
jgi:hypothetical protein